MLEQEEAELQVHTTSTHIVPMDKTSLLWSAVCYLLQTWITRAVDLPGIDGGAAEESVTVTGGAD